MKVQNVPNYAYEDSYVVAREYDGEWWYWGSYETRAEAAKAAREIDGRIFEVNEIR